MLLIEKGTSVSDKSSNEHPLERMEEQTGQSEESATVDELNSIVPTPRLEKQSRPRKKVPIVNRKGPSEVDQMIKMSRSIDSKTAQGRRLREGSMSHGTIVRIDRAKGFGFLIDSAGEQRFFHRTAVLDGGFSSLEENQSVEFQVHNDERGARALKVRPSSSPGAPSKYSPRPQNSPKAEKAPAWRSALSPFRNGSSSPSYSGENRSKERNRK